MRWPWQKKRLQWIPRPGLLPHPRLVRWYPELADVEHNPHFRMLMAETPFKLSLQDYFFLSCLPILVAYPLVLNHLRPPHQEPMGVADLAIGGLLFFVILLIRIELNPLNWQWCFKHLLPTEQKILADYIGSGISPSDIVTGIAVMDLPRNKQSALGFLLGVGLAFSVVSVLLIPSNAMFWTRGGIMATALWRLGTWIWPTGLAYRRVLRAARQHKIRMDRSRNPLREWTKTVILVIPAAVAVAALMVICMIILARITEHQSRNGFQWSSDWAIRVAITLGAIGALGVIRARFLLARESANRRRAEEIVGDLLEWKREQIFERNIVG